MSTIRKEFKVAASPEAVWDVYCDLGAVHTRLAKGFVTDTKLDGASARIVTFANGFTAREQIVTIDNDAKRLVYSVQGGQLTHHNASFQVFADGAGSRIVWIADLLPDDAAGTIGGMMDMGAGAMAKSLAAA